MTGIRPLTGVAELDQIIGRVRHHGMMAGLITNGYLLTAERIERLNRAGLEHMQINSFTPHSVAIWAPWRRRADL